MKERTTRIIKAIFSVGGMLFATKIVGFIKQIVTAGLFGATIETDLISISEGLVSDIDYLCMQVVSTAFLPQYILLRKKQRQEGEQFVSDVIKTFFFASVGIFLIFFIGAHGFAGILAPTYRGHLRLQLATNIRVFSMGLIPIALSAVFIALLRANERFVPGETIGLSKSIWVVVTAIVLADFIGPRSLVVAFYIYTVWNLIYLAYTSRNYWGIIKGNPIRNPNVQYLLRLIGPIFLGYSVVFVNQQVDKILVSGLQSGTVTAMGYAAVLNNLVSSVVGVVCTVVFTYVVKNVAEEQHEAAARLVAKTGVLLTTAILPISIIFIINSKEIVKLVFGRGAFDTTAVNSAAVALAGYSIMLVPLVYREMFCRLQYSYQDTKSPMINSTIGILINIILSISLCPIWGVFGVTIASSVSVAVCSILNAFSVKKHNQFIAREWKWSYVLIWIVGGMICCLLNLWVGNISVFESEILNLGMTVLISGIGYVVAVFPILTALS